MFKTMKFSVKSTITEDSIMSVYIFNATYTKWDKKVNTATCHFEKY